MASSSGCALGTKQIEFSQDSDIDILMSLPQGDTFLRRLSYIVLHGRGVYRGVARQHCREFVYLTMCSNARCGAVRLGKARHGENTAFHIVA
jgi:hypothetical protein